MSNEDKGFNPKYDDNKKEDIIYFREANKKSDGSTYRKVELIVGQEKTYLSKKNTENNDVAVPFAIKEDVVLFETRGGQQKIHCWLMESTDGKETTAICISRRTGKEEYGAQEVTLTLETALKLKIYLNNLFVVDTSNHNRFKIPVTELGTATKGVYSKIISEEEFASLIKANIHNTDDFYKLISLQKRGLAITELEKIIKGNYSNEVSIQKFLKNNLWMFGNDYSFVIEDEKINAENILDMIPQNFESYIDIIEVKLPNEKLFMFDKSHNNFYSSAKLTQAIAQTQNYIFELENKTQDLKYQQENNCKIIRPKGIVLFGTNEELNDAERKYLRILNSSYHNLHIITFQQLLEKAKNSLNIF